MEINTQINTQVVQKLITVVDKGLCYGLGDPKPGYMCVEAAVCYALGMRHDDEPPCVHPILRRLKISVNDSRWSNKQARARGLRRLAVLQLGTDRYFDAKSFARKLLLFTVQEMLPILLENYPDNASDCQKAKTLKTAHAAISKAYFILDGRLYYDDNLTEAIRYAKDGFRNISLKTDANLIICDCLSDFILHASGVPDKPKERNRVLMKFAKGIEDILIEMKVPAIKYLPLLGE